MSHPPPSSSSSKSLRKPRRKPRHKPSHLPRLTRIRRNLQAALQFYTLIPLYRWVKPPTAEERKASHSYLPAVGLLLGSAQLLWWWIASSVINHAIFAALFTAIGAWLLPIVVSRGLHEDGLADFADGVFGGTTVEHRLLIMKDSRIGAFGVIALIADTLIFIASYAAVIAFAPPQLIAPLILLAAITPRILALLLTLPLPYLRRDHGIIATKQLDLEPSFYVISALSLAALTFAIGFRDIAGISGISAVTLPLAAALAMLAGVYRVLSTQLKGYTGDCLGAAIKLMTTATVLAAALQYA